MPPPSRWQPLTRQSISTSIQGYSRKPLPSHRAPNTSRLFTTSIRTSSTHYRRSDFTGQPYTSSYEANTPTRGPLSSSPANGVPKVTPKDLKRYLDKYVVGQDRSKITLATAIYNHYQLVLRRQRLEEDEQKRLARIERSEAFESHPVDSVDGFSQPMTANLHGPRGYRYDRQQDRHQDRRVGSQLLEESRPINIEKSNVLMLGPTGVGKTLIVK